MRWRHNLFSWFRQEAGKNKMRQDMLPATSCYSMSRPLAKGRGNSYLRREPGMPWQQHAELARRG